MESRLQFAAEVHTAGNPHDRSRRRLSWRRVQIVTMAGFLVACCVLFGKSVEAPANVPAPPQVLWVTVDGQPHNDGSPEHPLDLATALSGGGPTRPGATVWLRGGVYRGSFTSTLNGMPDAPILVRQVPGERAVIDSAGSGRDALSVIGSYTWFWGFEITSSNLKRHSSEKGSWPDDLERGYGAVTRAPGTRFINLVVHDNANGLGLWSEASESDAYGNIVYNNGWQAPDRAHGHGIYTQNESGTRRISENIIFNQFSHGIHAYGSDQAHLDNITLEGNIVFNNGALAAEPEYVRNLLLGGGRPALNPRLENNITYFDTVKSAGENNIGYSAGCVNLWARGNYLVGGRPLVLGSCTAQMFAGNTMYGREREVPPIEYGGNEYLTVKPTGTRVFVRPNRCESGRAHVAIFNWDSHSRVSVDLSAASLVKGERFVVLDAQDYFGSPVIQGIYDGPIGIPMTGLRAEVAVGDVSPAAHTAPHFAAFVIVQPSVVAESATSVPEACMGRPQSADARGSLLHSVRKFFGF